MRPMFFLYLRNLGVLGRCNWYTCNRCWRVLAAWHRNLL